jgi:lipopolysaccharide transport system ATP-binding protein
MSKIIVDKLTKEYKSFDSKYKRLIELFTGIDSHNSTTVLKDISFVVEPGDSLGIVGVNGAGKSTLLKIITGTTHPTKGKVSLEGKVSALLELGMGFHPEFTGRQNAYMAGNILGYTNDFISSVFDQIEKFAEIGDYIDHPVRTYSSGMMVRLAFSVATMARPDILIVDEALSVGDAYFQAKCYERISEFRKKGTTLLLVSHNAGDITKHCNKALFLKEGKVDAYGSSDYVINKYLDALFGKNKVTKNLVPIEEGEKYHNRVGYRKEEYRWGDRRASIRDFKLSNSNQVETNHFKTNEMLSVRLTAEFSGDINDLVVGFLIKSLSGEFLYGINSKIINGNTICAVANSSSEYEFELPVSLNEGSYMLSLGLSSKESGELIPLDRRYDSIIIQVTNMDEFWGIIDLKADFTELVN